ncbi:hypothetical protein [Robiginitalea sediminis]|uniref:hypothetical protein n=1 Tax=Robiginitalea sediminis TaxID=1982593 RepID=UPI000B4B7FB2|nr:hypothetical protein [Robiginitalea sediminis]
MLFSKDKATTVSIMGFDWTHNALNNQSFVWLILNDLGPLSILMTMFVAMRNKYKYALYPFILYYSLDIISVFLWSSISVTLFKIETIIILMILILFLTIFQGGGNKETDRYDRLITFKLLVQEFLNRKLRKLNNCIEDVLAREKDGALLKRTYTIYRSLEVLACHAPLQVKNNFGKDTPIRTSRIAILSFSFLLLFIWNFIPDGGKISIGSLEIGSNGFVSSKLFIWYILGKASIIITLLVLLSISRHWWKYSLIVPITLYSYQFYRAFLPKTNIEAESDLPIIPIILLFTILAFYASIAAKNAYKSLDYIEVLGNQLDVNISKLSKIQ